MNLIINKFKVLEEEARQKSGKGIIRRLISSDIPLLISLGVYTLSLKHLIIFEIDKEYLNNIKCLPLIKGIKINKICFGDEKKSSICLVLEAASDIYNPSFDILSEDLYNYIKDFSEKKFLSKLSDRLHLWKKFFSSKPCELMSEENQIGLAGEIDLIIHLLESKMESKKIINSWKGYDSSSKDFIFQNTSAVEVKTCKSVSTVRISSEAQLDENENIFLFMFLVKIAFSNESEYSLNILIDKVRDYLNNKQNTLNSFNAGLMEYGYFDLHREYYDRHFIIKSEKCLLVHSDFPRIKKSDLKNCVNSVKYIIDLKESYNFEKPFKYLFEKINEDSENV